MSTVVEKAYAKARSQKAVLTAIWTRNFPTLTQVASLICEQDLDWLLGTVVELEKDGFLIITVNRDGNAVFHLSQAGQDRLEVREVDRARDALAEMIGADPATLDHWKSWSNWHAFKRDEFITVIYRDVFEEGGWKLANKRTTSTTVLRNLDIS